MIRETCDVCGGEIDVERYSAPGELLPVGHSAPLATIETAGAVLSVRVEAGRQAVCGPCRASVMLALAAQLRVLGRSAGVAHR